MNSYPVNLLLENRQCLVIGGGPVALRKVTRLLTAGAQVKVVAPEVIAGLNEMAAEERLEIILRTCREDDLADIFLAFFASDDRKFNQQMMLQAQSQGILSCAVDENWITGDFITPASCDGAGLQLAIATGGQSCVRSKSIKNLLSVQLETLAAKVILTTFTIAGKYFDNKLRQDLPAAVAGLLKSILGIREFSCHLTAGHLEIVALLSNDEKVNQLLRLILADAAARGDAGNVIKERCGEQAFIYLLQKKSTFVETYGHIGSGLKKLNSLIMKPEDLQVGSKEKWKEYENYCRKL